MQKKIVLKAFEIIPPMTTTAEFNPREALLRALELKHTASSRIMTLTDMNSEEEVDLLTYFEVISDCVFGSYFRLKRGQIGEILNAQLENDRISLETITSRIDESRAGIVIGCSYFCLNRNRAIHWGSRVSTKSFEAYLNWLIKDANPAFFGLQLIPIISQSAGIPLSEIAAIQIDESSFASRSDYQTMVGKIDSLKSAFMTNLIQEATDLVGIQSENVISASIVLKVLRSRKTKNEGRERALRAILRSTDADAIVIKKRDGKTLRGDSFEEKKEISVDRSIQGWPSEIQVHLAMQRYLQEIVQNEARV